MDKKKIEKARKSIQALLVKSTDSGATEAEKYEAFLMAQKLMIKYNVDEVDMKFGEHLEDRMKEVYHKPLTEYMKLPFWYGNIATIIAKNFRCHAYTEPHPKQRKRRIIMIGIRDDVEIAADVFKYACKAADTLSKEYIEKRSKEFAFEALDGKHKKAIKNDYLSGYVKGLKEKFEEQVAKDELALAIITPALVVKEVESMGLKRGAHSSAVMLGDRRAKEQGYNDGRSFMTVENK